MINHPGAPRHPSTGGEFTDAFQPNSPPVEGCRPQAAGWFTPTAQLESFRNPSLLTHNPNPYPLPPGP